MEIVLQRQRARVEALPEGGIPRVEEALAKDGDGRFNVVPQVVKGLKCAFSGFLRPGFEQAAFGRRFLPFLHRARFHAGLVAQQPEQREVREGGIGKNGFQVKFYVCLAAEAGAVAQDAQNKAVGHKAPEVAVGAVEEFLHQGVRAGLRRSYGAALADIEPHIAADEMDGRRIPHMGYGIGNIVPVQILHGALAGRGGLQAAVAELVEQRQEEVLARLRRTGFSLPDAFSDQGEAVPEGNHALPGTVDGLVDLFGRRQVVIFRPEPGQVPVQLQDAVQNVDGKDLAFRAHVAELASAFRHGWPPFLNCSAPPEDTHRSQGCPVRPAG